MKVFFLDESGFCQGDWRSETNLKEQPFHVLSGVCFSADTLPALYEHIRESIVNLKIAGITAEKLGKGFEIKARDIARGGDYWGKHETERNAVRNIFLESVAKFEGTAFLSVVNKPLHAEKYAIARDPTFLALRYIYERFERFLKEVDDFGICVHDQNKQNEDRIQTTLSRLNADGSVITYYSRLLDAPTAKHQRFTKILENVFGHSQASLGLQIADFFATQTNFYLKAGRPTDSGWWKVIYGSLKTEPSGKPEGYGYKEFP